MSKNVQCVRCGEERPGVATPPFRNELGQRIQSEICEVCWQEWLFRQTQLINHYGLDVRQAPAREFLLKNLKAFLFDEGPQAETPS